MYELKKLQHGDKPVTGTESRENVDKFFTKRQQTNERSIPVANVDDVEEHRPQQVTMHPTPSLCTLNREATGNGVRIKCGAAKPQPFSFVSVIIPKESSRVETETSS